MWHRTTVKIMIVPFVVRPELIEYSRGDILLCVVGEDQDESDPRFHCFAEGEEIEVTGVPWLSHIRDNNIRVKLDSGHYDYNISFMNGSTGHVLFVIKDELTEEEYFYSKLSGWR